MIGSLALRVSEFFLFIVSVQSSTPTRSPTRPTYKPVLTISTRSPSHQPIKVTTFPTTSSKVVGTVTLTYVNAVTKLSPNYLAVSTNGGATYSTSKTVGYGNSTTITVPLLKGAPSSSPTKIPIKSYFEAEKAPSSTSLKLPKQNILYIVRDALTNLPIGSSIPLSGDIYDYNSTVIIAYSQSLYFYSPNITDPQFRSCAHIIIPNQQIFRTNVTIKDDYDDAPKYERLSLQVGQQHDQSQPSRRNEQINHNHQYDYIAIKNITGSKTFSICPSTGSSTKCSSTKLKLNIPAGISVILANIGNGSTSYPYNIKPIVARGQSKHIVTVLSSQSSVISLPTTNAPSYPPTNKPITNKPITYRPITNRPITNKPMTTIPTTTPSIIPTIIPSTKPSFKPLNTPTSSPLISSIKSPTNIPITVAKKKGFVYTGNTATSAAMIQKVNPVWYYNWGSIPTTGMPSSTIPFSPMVWGKNTIPPTTAYIILGFNEPDSISQSNLSPITAINLWKQNLVPTGATKFGSPATAENPVTGTWLKTFLAGNGTYIPKVDFICIHRYQGPDANEFLSFIDSVWSTFNKPIWVTEYAVADWSSTSTKSNKYTIDQVITFMKQTVIGMESRSYVLRYSWKTRTTSDPNMWFSALFNDDESLTALGQIYSNL